MVKKATGPAGPCIIKLPGDKLNCGYHAMSAAEALATDSEAVLDYSDTKVHAMKQKCISQILPPSEVQAQNMPGPRRRLAGRVSECDA